MNKSLPIAYLVGHAETAWSLTGQQMGVRDLPLTEGGERNALRLKERLRGLSFIKVFNGPLQRIFRTCELAGFAAVSELDPDLADWDSGSYEGRPAEEILRERPMWNLFRDGCPGGESPMQVTARAERVIQRLRTVEGNVLIFSSLYLLRVIAARWISPDDPCLGNRFLLSPGSLSGLGYEHSFRNPVILFWNDINHIGG